MAKKEEKQEAAPAPGYVSVDRKGVWYFNVGVFPQEDPTHVGKGVQLTRFEPYTYTQAEKTPWTEAQWRAGAFKKYDGDPRDEGTKEVPYEEPKPTSAAAPAEGGQQTAAAAQQQGQRGRT